jgi:transcriptional regulator with XRE-family HTH domain
MEASKLQKPSGNLELKAKGVAYVWSWCHRENSPERNREGQKLNKQQSSSKRLWLIAAAVVAILALAAVPAFAATQEDNPRADAIAELFGFADAEAFADFLGFEVDEEEPAGPASSNNADEFAEALGFDSAEELAEDLGLEGGEDELAQVIQDSDNPNQLAEALNFDTPDELAEYLGVPRSVLAQALRDQSGLDQLAELQELAESEGYDEDEFAQLMQDYSSDPQGLAETLGFDRPNDLAEYLGLEDRRELAQLLRDSTDEDSDKLGELAELNDLAESLGYDNLRELAEALGLENRAQLVRVFQDADTPNELADALGYGSAQELAEELGVDRSELRTLLDSAKSDDGDEGSADNGNDGDEGSANNNSNDGGGNDSSSNDEESAGTGVSQEASQEAESGDVDQSFTVTNSGDNSNQSAGVQGVANTGNAQTQTTIVQSGSEAEDVEVEGGSSIEVSPEQGTKTQQEVEQAAAAAAE